MKKLIAMMLLVVSLVAVLVSCGSFKCAMCGEEKTDAYGETEEVTIAGETITVGVCTDCAEKYGLE